MALELVRAGDVKVGDRVMQENYDEGLDLSDYAEDQAEEVIHIERVTPTFLGIQTKYEIGSFDMDQLVMRVAK